MILDESPCKPFDSQRRGLNLGEGAAYLVLEKESSARQRGVAPLGVIAGTGNACDAFHHTASSVDGEGAFLAMTKALASAGLNPEDIDYVNAHGTATPNNDASESAALRRVFGDYLPPISSTKGLTGHTTSACGSIETIFCLLALQHQFIPRKRWLHHSRPRVCDALPWCRRIPSAQVCGLQRFRVWAMTQPSFWEIMENKVYVIAMAHDIPEADYRNYVSPMKTRRYSRLLKRALVTALKCMQDSGIAQPDAIISGTALGSLEESEHILDGLVTEGETVSMPTQFMLCTHNAVASLIGIYTHNVGYNNTFSQAACHSRVLCLMLSCN
jgi:3-oxoacyl-(acyl-carrier-protein) synthase